MGKKKNQEQEQDAWKVTDIEALKENTVKAVEDFAERWFCLPKFTPDCEIMDQGQLRDAMGLRATFDGGDPWPTAEKELLARGFRWSFLGTQRVMFLRERSDAAVDDGWQDGEEIV